MLARSTSSTSAAVSVICLNARLTSPCPRAGDRIRVGQRLSMRRQLAFQVAGRLQIDTVGFRDGERASP